MYITANGINLYYETCGSGPAIILLHGNGESGKIFNVVTPPLSKTHTVYRVDSRRHGKSQKKVPISYELMADDIAAFIQTLNIEKPVIFGFSDGAIVALILAIKYQGLTSKIIAAGPNITAEGQKTWFLRFMKAVYAFSHDDTIKLMITDTGVTPEQLQGITVPTVVLGGERDLIKPDHIRFIAQNIPGATCEIFKGENHMSYVVNTPKLYEILKKYI